MEEFWMEKVIDFVPQVGILLVRNGVTAAFGCDIFFKFQLKSMLCYSHDLLFQGLNPKLSATGGLLEIMEFKLFLALESW